MSTAPVILSEPELVQQFLHTLPNGLTLVAERIPGLRSAALTLLIPAGAASDPHHASGASSILSDWILRGAGSRDSRALTDYLDSLGVQRSSQPETVFIRFAASLLAKNLLTVLPVYADIVRRPLLPDDGFDAAQDLALQQLDAIDDEPAQKLSFLIREQHYGYPFGRSSVGIREQLESLTADQLREDYHARFTPSGAILSVAGMFDWAELKSAVEIHFGGWPAKNPSLPAAQPAPRGVTHLEQDTNQVQIGLAYDAPPESHPNAIYVHTAMAILSGGMGARLFTELREKQGLCYSVHAGYHALKHTGAVFGYSATAPDRAQQTLNAFIHELQKAKKGYTQDELDRAKIGMKSRIIMQGESSGARSAALAYDLHHRNHPRPLQEVRQEIDDLTLENLNHFAAVHPIEPLTVVTIGPKPLAL